MCLIHMRTTKVQISLRSLNSTFVVCCLDRICILATSKVSRFLLAFVAGQADLNLTWSQISEDRFLHDMAQIITCAIQWSSVLHFRKLTLQRVVLHPSGRKLRSEVNVISIPSVLVHVS